MLDHGGTQPAVVSVGAADDTVRLDVVDGEGLPEVDVESTEGEAGSG